MSANTDRELLEFAAKAAGYEVLHDFNEFVVRKNEGDSYPHAWNPRTDDGDSFRLAVKLGIEPRGPSRSRSTGRVVRAWYPPDGNPDRSACSHVTVSIKGDRCAATRLAILRAAAEIGREMT